MNNAPTVEISPFQAKLWLENNNFSKNRPLAKIQLNRLIKIIYNGEFISGTSLHFAILNGSEILVDGQHRLISIVDTGTSQRFTIVHHNVTDMVEVAHLYSTFDHHITRKPKDTYRAFGLDNETGLNLSQIGRSEGAITYIITDFGINNSKRQTLTDADMMQYIKEYTKEIKFFYYLLGGNTARLQRMFLRRSTFSIALVTLKYAIVEYGKDFVYDFWSGAIDGNMLQKNDPRKLLRDLFLSTRLHGGIETRGRYTKYQSIDFARFTALAWRYYAQQKFPSTFSINQLKNFPILGTSYVVPGK